METTERVENGSCQCGSRSYQVKLTSDDAYYCHCRMCQKAFGNIFATFINAKKSALTWLGEQPAYYHSSKLARRGFCPQCGTPLTFEYHDSQRLDLSLGSLDHPEHFHPRFHVGPESRVRTFAWPDQLPGKPIDTDEKYVAKWKAAHGAASTPGPLART